MTGLGYNNDLIKYMENKIDFSYLIGSTFFYTGTNAMAPDENKKASYQKREIPLFDAYCGVTPTTIRDLHNKTYRSAEAYTGASLARALDPSVKKCVKTAVIDQWAETYDIVDSLSVKPGLVHFAMQAPGADWGRHIHSVDCKQTITFCYSYKDYCIESEEPSRFIVETDKGDVSFPYPDGAFYFTFRDNPRHQSISNEWRFFWIYDFAEYVDVPELKLNHMKIEP